jgi:hypothetical protein
MACFISENVEELLKRMNANLRIDTRSSDRFHIFVAFLVAAISASSEAKCSVPAKDAEELRSVAQPRSLTSTWFRTKEL